MTNLANISIEEMQMEIEQRKQKAEKAAMPKPLSNPDFSPLIELCQEYINDLEEKGYADEDYDHWMFETAMQIVFGNDVSFLQ